MGAFEFITIVASLQLSKPKKISFILQYLFHKMNIPNNHKIYFLTLIFIFTLTITNQKYLEI